METQASRRFRKTGMMVTSSYFVLFLGSFYANHVLHPAGVMLWALASLPLLPILGVLFLFGRYLRDERDEYKRDLTMRCLLWGTAGFIAVSLLGDYLRIYGWTGRMPPFLALWVFFVMMMGAKLTYRAKNAPVEE